MKSKKYHINNNIIRKISIYLYNIFNLKNLCLSYSYYIIHSIFIFFICFITIFNTNIIHLIIILIIISLDAFSIIVLHGCPLTILEKKYLKISSSDIRRKELKKCNILYNCNHEYEKQIELLINVWMIIAGKCLIILFLKTFNIKLFNYNNIYI